jgi:hypothetical protein
MQRLALTFVLAVAICGCASKKSCTAIAVEGLVVTVTNSRSGARICDATVLAQTGGSDGGGTALQPSGPGAMCDYAGAPEAPGDYTITVSRNGFVTATARATVQQGDCHVVPADVTVTLDDVGGTPLDAGGP